MIRLAGIEITEESLFALVVRLRRANLDDHADRIVDALTSMQTEVPLTHPDRVAILAVLDDPPADLTELRAGLSQDVARARDALA